VPHDRIGNVQCHYEGNARVGSYVADVQLPNFAPRSNTRYRKIKAVVDAVTGKVILSYPVEPMERR